MIPVLNLIFNTMNGKNEWSRKRKKKKTKKSEKKQHQKYTGPVADCPGSCPLQQNNFPRLITELIASMTTSAAP